MPTPLTHAAVGAALACLPHLRPGLAGGLRPPVSRLMLVTTCAGLAVLPDLDLVGFQLGISYGAMFGHRGLSHSVVFALAAGLVASMILLWRRTMGPGQRLSLMAVTVMSALSHGVLDAATSGGLGVGFLLPFSDQRYFWPVRPIVVSPIHPARFLERAVEVLGSEILSVWLPMAVLAAVLWCLRRLQRTGGAPAGTR